LPSIGRLIIYTGIVLVAAGYLVLYSISAEAEFVETTNRVFIGMGLVIVGAAATFGALFFKK
jgi:hypothetical protein